MTEEQITEAAWNYAVNHKLQELDETAMLAMGNGFVAGVHYAQKQLKNK